MKVVFNPEPSLSFISTVHNNNPRNSKHFHVLNSLRFSSKYLDPRIPRRLSLTVKSVLDSATIDQLGLAESDIRNPALSSSYRRSQFPRPNQTVLDAQARVCTGPTQTRPLGEDQAFKVLDTILRSGGYIFLNLVLG